MIQSNWSNIHPYCFWKFRSPLKKKKKKLDLVGYAGAQRTCALRGPQTRGSKPHRFRRGWDPSGWTCHIVLMKLVSTSSLLLDNFSCFFMFFLVSNHIKPRLYTFWLDFILASNNIFKQQKLRTFGTLTFQLGTSPPKDGASPLRSCPRSQASAGANIWRRGAAGGHAAPWDWHGDLGSNKQDTNQKNLDINIRFQNLYCTFLWFEMVWEIVWDMLKSIKVCHLDGWMDADLTEALKTYQAFQRSCSVEYIAGISGYNTILFIHVLCSELL